MKKAVRIFLLVIMILTFLLGGVLILNGVMPIVENGFSFGTIQQIQNIAIAGIFAIIGALVFFYTGLLLLIEFLKKRFSTPILSIEKVGFMIGLLFFITAIIPLGFDIYSKLTAGEQLYLYVGDLLYILIGFLFLGFNAAAVSAFKKRSFLPFFIYSSLNIVLAIVYILLNGNFYSFGTMKWYQLVGNIFMLAYLAISVAYYVLTLILSIQQPALFIHKKLDGKEYLVKKVNKRGLEVLRVYEARRGKAWIATLIFGLIGGVALLTYSVINTITSLSSLNFNPILITDINNITNVIDIFTAFYPLTYIPISLLLIYGLIFRDGYYYHHPLKVRSFISLFFAASVGTFLVNALNHNYDAMAFVPIACYVVAIILKYISLWSSGPAMADLRKGESFKENARVLLGPMILSVIASAITAGAYLFVTIYQNRFDYTVIIFFVAVGFLLLFSIFESISPLEESFIYKRLPPEENQ